VAVLSSRPQFGSFTGDEHAAGLVTARDPKTGKWAATIFLTLKGGKIRDNPEYLPLEPILKTRKTDIVLLAMDKRTADIFLKEEFVLGDDILVLPGTFGEIAKPGEPVYAVSTGMIAYIYNTGRILGVSISESSLKQDKTVNNAVYEEKRIDTFLPANKSLSPRLLSFTEILNQYYSAYAYR
jgi:lipid-binding SYLF domain-containing protein